MKHPATWHRDPAPRHIRRLARTGVAIVAIAALASTAGCASSDAGDSGKTTIEFAQWWEPELPDGLLADLIDQFEAENPDITVKLLSNPYASTQQQIFANATAGQFPDVVGLDGSWVNQLSGQGALADLDELADEAGFDTSVMSAKVQVEGTTYSIPTVNFPYVLYTNDDLLAQAGVDAPPVTRSEFLADAEKITAGTDASATAIPLSLTDPSGVQIAVLNWLWASQGTMLTEDRGPDIDNSDVKSLMEFIKQLYDDGSVAPGAFTMPQQDMVQGFTNGKVAMMLDSPAHLNGIRADNPDLKFSVSQIPLADDYSGQPGIPGNAWGVGVSAKSDNQEAAFKLVQFLWSKDANGTLASGANAFPGNTEATPDFEGKDPLYQTAFEIYQKAKSIENEFSGLPKAQDLMRTLDEQLQSTLDGKQSIDELLDNTQTQWAEVF